MELKFALLCDAANESREGKLNITGEFDTIWVAGKFPVVWPRAMLAARIEAHPTEGGQHQFTLRMTDADHKDIAPPAGPVPFQFAQRGPGLPLRAQMLVTIDGMRFERAGQYSIHIIVDGRHEASVPLFVRERPAEKPPRKTG